MLPKYLVVKQEHYYILVLAVNQLQKLMELKAPKKKLLEQLDKIHIALKLIKEVDEVI